MLFHFFSFPTFLIATVAMGKLFFYFLSKIIRLPDIAASGLGLQGIAGLFFMGVIGVVFNFFLPLASLSFYLILGICALSGGIVLFKSRKQVQMNDIWIFLILSMILAPIAGSLSPGFDGGLYHLPHQLWLRSEAIVIGLANLHGRFGFGSLYEYISAPLWIGEQFTLLSYLQISFMVFFLLFLVKLASISHGPHLVLLAGISLNTALYFDYIILGYTYTDSPSGFIFAASFIYGHWLLYKDDGILRGEWTIFLILILSAIFYKVSSILLLVWYVFVSFYRIHYKQDSMHECLLGFMVPGVFLIIYLIRNLVTTGCLLYPASATCLDLPWSATKNAVLDADSITAWARHPGTGLYSLQDNSWFFNWWLPQFHAFLTYLLNTGIGICAIYIVLALLNRLKSISFLNIRIVASVGFVLIAFLFWFWKAPTPRFGIGVFLLFFPVLFLFLNGKGLEQSSNWRKSLHAIVILGVIIFACRIGVPWERISYANMLTLNALTVPTPEVTKDSVYGVRPPKNSQCWIVPECAPYNRPPISSWQGHIGFYIE